MKVGITMAMIALLDKLAGGRRFFCRQAITFAAALILALLLAPTSFAQAKPKPNNPNLTVYFDEDKKEFVEVEDITASDPMYLVRVKNKLKKPAEMDSFPVAGKITKIEFAALNTGEDKSIAVYFDDKNNLHNIAVYKPKDNKFFKIFAGASEYAIETEFTSAARIKIGKAPQGKKTPDLAPVWDTWVWSGEKFVLD